jgi:pimeloyl-ACP methyl ester carboxylesterase
MAYWALVIRNFSTSFISDVQTLGATLESHIDLLHNKMGQLAGLVNAPFQLSRPFLGQSADIYQQHATMILHETGYRVGGEEMSRYMSETYGEGHSINSYSDWSYYYQTGRTLGGKGIIGLFLDYFKQLASIVEQHTEGVIGRIETECLTIPVTRQGKTLDNDIVSEIITSMLGNSSPKDVLDRMFRLGGAFSDGAEAAQIYQKFLYPVMPTTNPSPTLPHTTYAQSTPHPTPGPAPTPPGLSSASVEPEPDQIIPDAYARACQHLIDVVKGYGDALSRSYHTWNADFDDNVRLYFASREMDFSELYKNWQMSAADLFNKINAPTTNKKLDQTIGVTMGLTQDGQTAVIVTISGLELEMSKWGHAFDLRGALSEGVFNDSHYRQLAYDAVQQYLAEHNLPPNTVIIIGGHSLGGMVGEDLVDKYDPQKFNLQEVVTFGSPDQGSNFPTATAPTKLNMYYSSADPVPYLPYEGKTLLFGSGNDPNGSQNQPYDPMLPHPYVPQDPVQLAPGKYALLPDQREHEVTLPGINPADGKTFAAHGDYGNSPDLKQGGKYSKLDFTLIGGTEYYSA